MIATIVLAFSLVSFPGGSTADLTASVEKSTGRNVFIAQSFVKYVKKFDYETKSFEDLAFDIRMNAKVHLMSSTELVFGEEMLPPERMAPTQVGLGALGPAWKTVQGVDVSEGKVTFHTVGAERLDPATLARSPFSKPVTVHWLLGKYGVAINAEKMDEKQFLTCIAQSGGGKLIDGKDGYVLDLDAEELRKRALNLLAEKIASDPQSNDPAVDRKSSMRIYSEILRGADRKTIKAAFSSIDSRETADLDYSSPVVAELLSKVRIQSNSANFADRGRVALKTPGGDAFLDPRSPSVVELRGNFTAKVSFKTLDSQGKPGDLSLEVNPNG